MAKANGKDPVLSLLEDLAEEQQRQRELLEEVVEKLDYLVRVGDETSDY